MIAIPIESQPEELECTGSRGLLVRWGRASARERGRPGPILDEGLPARGSVRPAMKNLDRPRFRTHFRRLYLTLLTNRPLHFYQRCPARPRGTGRKTKQEKIRRKRGVRDAGRWRRISARSRPNGLKIRNPDAADEWRNAEAIF